jgi:hypothetical protein
MNTPMVATSNAGPSILRNSTDLLTLLADGSLSPTLKGRDLRHSDKMHNKIVSQSCFFLLFSCRSCNLYLLS